MSRILINAEVINWPKTFITEDQLRTYCDAAWNDDLIQVNAARQEHKVTGVAELRHGMEFYSRPGVVKL